MRNPLLISSLNCWAVDATYCHSQQWNSSYQLLTLRFCLETDFGPELVRFLFTGSALLCWPRNPCSFERWRFHRRFGLLFQILRLCLVIKRLSFAEVGFYWMGLHYHQRCYYWLGNIHREDHFRHWRLWHSLVGQWLLLVKGGRVFYRTSRVVW